MTAKSPSDPSAVWVRAAGPVKVQALVSASSKLPFFTAFFASTVTDAVTLMPVDVVPGIEYVPGPRM